MAAGTDQLALVIEGGQVQRIQSGDSVTGLAGAGGGFDVSSAGAMEIGANTATGITLGKTGVDTTVAAALLLQPGATGGIDVASAGDLYIGDTTAGTIFLGRAGQNVEIVGNEIVNGTTLFEDDTTIGDDITDTLKFGGVIINRTVAPTGGTSLLFDKDQNHIVQLQNQSTAGTAGSDITMQSAEAGAGSGADAPAGGDATMSGGAGGVAVATFDGGTGGTALVIGGAGGAGTAGVDGGMGGQFAGTAGAGGVSGSGTGGTGGNAGLTAGAGGASNGAGGDCTLAGGLGNGTGNGGSINIDAGGTGSGTKGDINIGTTTGANKIVTGNATDDPQHDMRGYITLTSTSAKNPLLDLNSASQAQGGVNFAESIELNSTGTGAESASIMVGDGNPNGNVTAGLAGSLFLDGANGSVYLKTNDASTWTALATGAGNSLQQAYVQGNTIAVTTAEGSVALSNSTDVTDTLTVSRTFAGAGDGIAVTMGGGGEAVTGDGISVSMGTGATASSGLNVTTTHGSVTGTAGAVETNVSGAQGGLNEIHRGATTDLYIRHDNTDYSIETNGTATASTVASGLTLTAGDSGTDAAGAAVEVFTGLGGDYAASAAGAGGEFDVTAGDGGFSTVATAAGAGGALDFNAGTGGNNTFAGAGTGGAGGVITIDGGLGGDANNASATSGAGGNVTITAGQAGSSTSGSAGAAGILQLTGGAGAGTVGTGTGDGGDVQIAGGAATTGQGGSVVIDAGNGSTTDGDVVVGLNNALNIDLNASQNITADASTGSISLDAAAASNFSTSAGNLTLDAAAGELVLDDVGNQGLTVSETGDRTLDPGFTATSIIGALNELFAGVGGDRASFTATTAEAIATGAPVAFNTTNGAIEGNADNAASPATRNNAIGLALTGVGSAATVTIVTSGEVTVPDAQWDSAPVAGDSGSIVYLSDTVGNLTKTAPSGGGDRVLKIGLITFADNNTDTTKVAVMMPDSVKL